MFCFQPVCIVDKVKSQLHALPKVKCLLHVLGFDICLDEAWLELISPANIAQAIGGWAALLALISSLSLIYRHWRYNTTKLKKPTVRLLFVVPIFALDSWACLMLEASELELAEIITCFREIYEAIALLSFLELVLTILGGAQELARTLKGEDSEPVEHFWPLRLVLSPYLPGAEFLAAMLAGIFQYVICCLGIFLVVCFIWSLGRLGLDPSIGRALQMIPNAMKACSCAWALNCLVLFAHEVRDHVPHARLVLKFVSIKGIVFFTFWQGLVIACLDRAGVIASLEAWASEKARRADLSDVWWDENQIRSGLNDLLLCIEVLFFSVLHWFAYPVEEVVALPDHFQRRILTPPNSPPVTLRNAVNFMDVRELLHQIARLRRKGGCERCPYFAHWRDLRKPLGEKGLLPGQRSCACCERRRSQSDLSNATSPTQGSTPLLGWATPPVAGRGCGPGAQDIQL